MICNLIERIGVFITLEEEMWFSIKSEIELIVKSEEIMDIANKMILFVNTLHGEDTLLVPFLNGLCRYLGYFRSALLLLN